MHLRDSRDFDVDDLRKGYGYIKNDTIARILLERSEEFQIDVNAKDVKNGMTPLHCACRAGRTELVNYFLDNARDKRIDVCARDSKGKTILHHAVGSSAYRLSQLKDLFKRAEEFGLSGNERDFDNISAAERLSKIQALKANAGVAARFAAKRKRLS